ncbi:hypothetical protein D9M70_333670 [compost metagenome]
MVRVLHGHHRRTRHRHIALNVLERLQRSQECRPAQRIDAQPDLPPFGPEAGLLRHLGQQDHIARRVARRRAPDIHEPDHFPRRLALRLGSADQLHPGRGCTGGEAFRHRHGAGIDHRQPALEPGEFVRATQDRTRELQQRTRAHALFAVQRHLAIHHLGQPSRDRQAQSGAAEAARGTALALHERRKQALDIALRNADAGVFHADRHHGHPVRHRLRIRAQGHAALVSELDRIADQVEQDLAYPDPVYLNRRWHSVGNNEP